ncbi:MAG: alanyl-tRNA editing protein [Pseudomonadota bacterium]
MTALPRTDDLFRDDATLDTCRATVLAADAAGIVLDRTVFYPLGGGQAGDAGVLLTADGVCLPIADTRKHPEHAGAILHVPAAGADEAVRAAFVPGTAVEARIDVARRRAHMRFHTTTHLLCALVPHPVNGCSITAAYARLDFHMNEPLDKDALNAGLAQLVAEAHPVRHRWIGEDELDANPGLVRSMSVQPPRGQGRVRVLEIEGVDLQPCGGTHVANTADIGPILITKIEKKSAMTRRVILGFAEPGASPGPQPTRAIRHPPARRPAEAGRFVGADAGQGLR